MGLACWSLEEKSYLNDIISCQTGGSWRFLSFYSSQIQPETLLKQSRKVIPETDIVKGGANDMSPFQSKVTKTEKLMPYQSRGQPVLKQKDVFRVLTATSP